MLIVFSYFTHLLLSKYKLPAENWKRHWIQHGRYNYNYLFIQWHIRRIIVCHYCVVLVNKKMITLSKCFTVKNKKNCWKIFLKNLNLSKSWNFISNTQEYLEVCIAVFQVYLSQVRQILEDGPTLCMQIIAANHQDSCSTPFWNRILPYFSPRFLSNIFLALWHIRHPSCSFPLIKWFNYWVLCGYIHKIFIVCLTALQQYIYFTLRIE